MNQGILEKLWAKTVKDDPRHYHPLWCHLLDAAAACEALLPHFGGVENLPMEWICLFVGAHDIGKADDWFQNKAPVLSGEFNELGLELPGQITTNDKKRGFRHEARSAEWLKDHLIEQRGWKKRGAAQTIADAINGHHGDFAASAYSEENAARKALWDELRSELFHRLWSVLKPEENFKLDEFSHAGVAGLKLSGLIVLSDWLASNDQLWRYQELQKFDDPAQYWQATQERGREVVEEMRFAPSPRDWPSTPLRFGDVWPLRKQTPRPSQVALESEIVRGVAPGLCLIEAPMGEGKTEGALYLASEWNRQAKRCGVYMALPTQATSNQMHGRYRDFLKTREQDAPRLVHGMAWLIDGSTPESEPQIGGEREDRQLALEWFRPLRRALLAPDGVGTIDQALMAALHVKFGFLRLLGLGGKVLVVDEVHAYDDYMTTILQRLLQWCGASEIGVILLSATLSHEQKKRLLTAYSGREVSDEELPHSREIYPLLTFVSPGEKPREVGVPRDAARDRVLQIELHAGLLDDVFQTARLARELVADGGSVCVLCNTVKSAQEVFEELRSESGEAELFLFHARFCAGARKEIEDAFIARFGPAAGVLRPHRAIVVATQVVEQSLDVDFDFFISQIAPIDLLLQRSGRLHRHDPKTRAADLPPTLHVLLPPEGVLQFGASEKIYELEILMRTLSHLHAKSAWHLPQDFRALVEGVYARGDLPNDSIPVEELESAAQKRDAKRTDESRQARGSLLPEPNPRQFSIARKSKSEAEGEGETNSNFRAATRLGDDSRAAFVLHEPRLIELAKTCLDKNARAPRRDDLKSLFQNKVNLPAWWLQGAAPQDGQPEYFEGENWLRGQLVLPMQNREWKGVKDGKDFLIRDDEVLGLQRLTANVAEIGEDEEARTEADAGQTG